VSCVEISEDGSLVATGSMDCTCLIWDAHVLSGVTPARSAKNYPVQTTSTTTNTISSVSTTPIQPNSQAGKDGIPASAATTNSSPTNTTTTATPTTTTTITTESTTPTYSSFSPSPKLILYGHDRAIMCVDISADLDLVATGSDDSTAILFNLSDGSYLRSFTHQDPVRLVKIAPQGLLITYCQSINFNEIYVHTINGKHLTCATPRSQICAMVISDSGDYLVTGGENGNVVVRSLYLFTLKPVHEWKCKSKVLCLTFLNGEGAVFLAAGLESGELKAFKFDPEKFRKEN